MRKLDMGLKTLLLDDHHRNLIIGLGKEDLIDILVTNFCPLNLGLGDEYKGTSTCCDDCIACYNKPALEANNSY